jgi:hypothetical protein
VGVGLLGWSRVGLGSSRWLCAPAAALGKGRWHQAAAVQQSAMGQAEDLAERWETAAESASGR